MTSVLGMCKQNCLWSAASPQSSLSLELLWWFGGGPKVIQGNGAPPCLLVPAAVTAGTAFRQLRAAGLLKSEQAKQGVHVHGSTPETGTLLHQPPN